MDQPHNSGKIRKIYVKNSHRSLQIQKKCDSKENLNLHHSNHGWSWLWHSCSGNEQGHERIQVNFYWFFVLGCYYFPGRGQGQGGGYHQIFDQHPPKGCWPVASGGKSGERSLAPPLFCSQPWESGGSEGKCTSFDPRGIIMHLSLLLWGRRTRSCNGVICGSTLMRMHPKLD